MGPNDSPGMNANPAEPSLLNDIAGMDTDASASGPSNPLLEESELGQADGQGQGNLFKFAGREYKDQAHAENTFKKMYGEYSETKGITNMVKKALQNPELLEALSEDPTWANIFAKLGIEADTRQVEREAPEQQGNQEMHEWRVEREVDRLEREEYRFERELGRAMKPEERRGTLELIARHNTMTFKEAWQLANHDRLLREARGGQPQAPRPKGNRPPPPPANTPGGSVNTRKPVHRMSESEWKDNLRNDPDIKDLLSR